MDPKDGLKPQFWHTARQALKELGEDTPERLTLLAQKCGYDSIEAVSIWQPYGGATSFDELTTYQRGETRRSLYDQLNWQLQNLMGNVLNAREMTDDQRAARIISLAEDFAQRAEAIPAQADEEVAEMTPGEADDTRARVQLKQRTAARVAPDASSFVAFKEGDAWRWLAVYSNNRYDNLGEVFPEQSHKDFLKWADQDPAGRYPELWDWHTPVGVAAFGLKDGKLGMGKADFLDYQDGMAIAAGHFYPEFYEDAERLSAQKDLGTSHGFEFAKWALKDDGSYRHHFTFEISPLPRNRAANSHTLFLPDMGTKEDLMQFRADRRAQLVTIHGETRVKAMEKSLGEAAVNMKDSGIDFKDFAEAVTAVLPDPETPPAAADAAIPVPAAATTAGGVVDPNTTGLKDLLTGVVNDALAPLVARISTLEASEKDMDARVAGMFGSRVRPNAGPSNDPANVVRGNRTEVKDAVQGAKEMPDNIPPHLEYYARGMGLVNAMSSAAAAAAGEGNEPSAEVIAAATGA